MVLDDSDRHDIEGVHICIALAFLGEQEIEQRIKQLGVWGDPKLTSVRQEQYK